MKLWILPRDRRLERKFRYKCESRSWDGNGF
jgi:hypothetical protein